MDAANLILKVIKSSTKSEEDIRHLSAIASHGGLLFELIDTQMSKEGIYLPKEPDDFDGF